MAMAYPGETSYEKHEWHPRGLILEALQHCKWPGRISFNLAVCFCWEVLVSSVWYFLGEDQGYSQAYDLLKDIKCVSICGIGKEKDCTNVLKEW